jgi:hypothetical protein
MIQPVVSTCGGDAARVLFSCRETANAFHSLPFVIEHFRREATKRMRLRPANCDFRAAAGASIALAVLVCAWPSRADAGCSHYVVAKNDAGQIAMGLPIFDLVGGGGLVGGGEVSGEAPARPKPCSGALCSGKPAVPVPVPIAVFRPVEAVVPRPPAPPAPRPTVQLLAYTERIVRAVIERPSIERPPR